MWWLPAVVAMLFGVLVACMCGGKKGGGGGASKPATTPAGQGDAAPAADAKKEASDKPKEGEAEGDYIDLN